MVPVARIEVQFFEISRLMRCRSQVVTMSSFRSCGRLSPENYLRNSAGDHRIPPSVNPVDPRITSEMRMCFPSRVRCALTWS